MNRSRASVLAGVLLLAVGVIVLVNRDNSIEQNPASSTNDQSRIRNSRPDPGKERELRDAASERTIENDWRELFARLETEPHPTPKEIRERLLSLRVAWAEKDFQVLAATLTRLLESGEDRNLGLAFRVGPQGFLQSWPTLRVFLLDVLAASDPEMAAVTAREVIAKTQSADEFVVAIRSLTREGSARASDDELLTHFNTLIAHNDWKNSGGFGEAFDLPRLLGTTQAATALANWNENPQLRNRALDEFSADHPTQALALLRTDTPLEGGTRATMMARANPADPAQLSAVDAYLRDPARQPEEASVFLKAFPLRSATTGYRLYGKTPAPYNFETIVAGDRAALLQVDQWINDPKLETYHPELTTLRERLEEWTQQTR